MSPLAERTRTSPVTAPITVVPLEFFTTAEPWTSPIWTLPVPVEIEASPVTAPTVTCPADVSRRSVPVRSTDTFPADVLSPVSPSRPAARRSPICTRASTREPVGNSMVTSTERDLREKSKVRFGPVTRSSPPA